MWTSYIFLPKVLFPPHLMWRSGQEDWMKRPRSKSLTTVALPSDRWWPMILSASARTSSLQKIPCCFVLLAPRSPTWSSCCWCPPPPPYPLGPALMWLQEAILVTLVMSHLSCIFLLCLLGLFLVVRNSLGPCTGKNLNQWCTDVGTEALLACFLEAFLNSSQEDYNSSLYSCNLLINIPFSEHSFSELSPPSLSLFYSFPWASRDYSPNKQTNQNPCFRVSYWKNQNQETPQSLEWAVWKTKFVLAHGWTCKADWKLEFLTVSASRVRIITSVLPPWHSYFLNFLSS